MKKVILSLMMMAIAAVAFSQKVYQAGAYGSQLLRPGHTTIKGVLIEKYFNKGYYWFTVVDRNTTFKISITKPDEFNNAKPDSAVVVTECFELASNKWKRK